MKRKLTLLLALLCIASGGISAKKPDTIRIESSIPVDHADRVEWLERYNGDIKKYRAESAKLKDKSCDVLFLGSSSINLWDDIYTDMAPMKIIRRSYGGSTVRDNIYNYDVVARGYSPKKIAIYIENDLGSHPEGIAPGLTYDLFRVYLNMLQAEYPEVPIYVISFKPSFVKEDQLKDQLIINALLEEYAAATPYVEYIDITKEMYDSDGNLREDIFVSDRLHLNRAGYDIWKAAIKPVLIEGLNSK